MKNNNSGWKQCRVDEVFDFVKSYAISRDNLQNGTDNAEGIGNIHYGDIHTNFSNAKIDVKSVSIPMIKDKDFVSDREARLINGDILMVDASEDYEGVGLTTTIHNIGNKEIVGGLHTFVLRDNKDLTSEYFRQYIFRNPTTRNSLQKIANGVSVYGISKNALSKIQISIPGIAEQNHIVSVLETWDKAIEKLKEKIKYKKQIKKYLMEELVSGKRRLGRFNEKWNTFEIGDLLDYEQPGKYIVSSSLYEDHYETPVLTANKSFILGYTDEKEGIYSKKPAIIFDDFTTDCKYVTFDFKVKSSAIKILTPKTGAVNLYILFEKIIMLKHAIGEHKRHYLSEYQYIPIDIPEIKEQNEIANILQSADKELDLLNKKLSLLQDQKKYLLNNLITGTIRTPEKLS